MERSAGRPGLMRERVLQATAGIMLLLIIINVDLSARWAQIEGLEFSRVVSGWLSGFRPDGIYSGVYLRALVRLDAACACLCIAILAAVGA